MDIRLVGEEDIDGLMALFRAAYGDDYAVRDVYDEVALKRGIYSDNIHWLVAEEDGRIVGSGALVLGLGDDNDQIGEIGRLVVSPEVRTKGLARQLVDALIAATGERVEFAFGETRTVHPFSQRMADATGMPPLGFMPMACQMGTRESFVFNGKLFGNGPALRAGNEVRVVPAVAPLAELSLRNLGLADSVEVVEHARGHAACTRFDVRPLDNGSLLRLLRIERGRIHDPEIFGPFHVDQGLSQVLARRAHYFVAAIGPRTVGGIGYSIEEHDCNLRITELIGDEPGVQGTLLQFVVDRAELVHAVRLLQCDVSAESTAMQQTMLELGFLPAGYMPGMVFHGTRRIDVVRFLKLSGAWEPGPLALVASSQRYHDLVAPAFARELAMRQHGDAWRKAWRARGFSPSELDVLRHWGHECEVEALASVDPRCMYVVLEGELGAGTVRAGVAGCVQGQALFGRASAAAAVALTACRLLRFQPDRFVGMSEQHPLIAMKLAGESLQ